MEELSDRSSCDFHPYWSLYKVITGRYIASYISLHRFTWNSILEIDTKFRWTFLVLRH
jgi:hypothetical protein